MDVLEALDVPILLGPEAVSSLISSCGIGFMFAPLFHPAMKHVAPVRKQLGFRTSFNFLGPLANPAQARLQVLGVSDKGRAPLMIDALRALGSERVLVVMGADGLDELTLTGLTHLWSLADGVITESTITPEELNLKRVPFEALAGGDAATNSRVFMAILNGDEKGARRDLVALNAAAGLEIAGKASDLRSGLEMARMLLESKKALDCFERYRDEARALSQEQSS